MQRAVKPNSLKPFLDLANVKPAFISFTRSKSTYTLSNQSEGPISQPSPTDHPDRDHKQSEKSTLAQNSQPNPVRRKTIAELDEELRAKLEERSGDGGAAGLELEDGKPVAMKRGVKENMFRLI